VTGEHAAAQRRRSDLRQGRRLSKHDRLFIWTRPDRPDWLDPAEYAAIPQRLDVRVIRFAIREPGRRTREIEVVTTLTDAEADSRDDIAELCGFRWKAGVSPINGTEGAHRRRQWRGAAAQPEPYFTRRFG